MNYSLLAEFPCQYLFSTAVWFQNQSRPLKRITPSLLKSLCCLPISLSINAKTPQWPPLVPAYLFYLATGIASHMYRIPATVVSLLFLRHTRPVPASGPFYSLCLCQELSPVCLLPLLALSFTSLCSYVIFSLRIYDHRVLRCNIFTLGIPYLSPLTHFALKHKIFCLKQQYVSLIYLFSSITINK